MVFFFLFIFFFFSFLIFIWLYWVFFFDFFYFREKSSVYECGFDSKDSSRSPFSLRFFSFLMLFVIFDVELVLLLSVPYSYDFLLFSFFSFFFFLIFVFFSMYEEWRRGYLDWYI